MSRQKGNIPEDTTNNKLFLYYKLLMVKLHVYTLMKQYFELKRLQDLRTESILYYHYY